MKDFIKWDLLSPEDIEVRVGNKIKGSDNVAMLLYQDSRCTARNLDKQFGQFGWQIDYKVVGEQIYGTLSIYDETKQMWISKSDTGDKSNISEDKGQSSDILKRCAVRWGFGVELYTSPKIVIPDDGYGNTGYKVSEIEYNEEREIIHLVIVNRFNKEVFRWDKDKINNPKPTQQPDNDELMWKPETEQPKVEDKINGLLASLSEQFNTLSSNEDINLQVLKDTANYWHKIIKDGKYKASNINLQKLYNNNLERRAA